MISVKDSGGTWRDAKAVFVRDGSAWRACKTVYVRDGSAWRNPPIGTFTAGTAGSFFGFRTAVMGSARGSVSPANLTIANNEITELSSYGTVDGGLFTVAVNAVVAQSMFTSITINGTETYLTASALSFSANSPIVGVSIWTWNPKLSGGIPAGSTITIT